MDDEDKPVKRTLYARVAILNSVCFVDTGS